MTEWIDRYVQAWNSHDARKVAELMAEDVNFEDVAAGQTHHSRQAVEAFAASTLVWSADLSMVVVTSQQDGDQYAFEWELSGTNTGAVAGLPATNKPFRIRGVSIGERDGEGRIVRNRDYWNLADYLVQVGILPELPGD